MIVILLSVFVPHASIHCSATPWFHSSSTCASLGQELPCCTTPVRLNRCRSLWNFHSSFPPRVRCSRWTPHPQLLFHVAYNANTFPNLRTLIAEHGIQICITGVSVFCSIMGKECVTSSTDVCAVTLGYMRVLLIDLNINVCVGSYSFIPRHGTQFLLSCLSTESCTITCSVTADRLEHSLCSAQPTCPKLHFIAIDKLRLHHINQTIR